MRCGVATATCSSPGGRSFKASTAPSGRGWHLRPNDVVHSRAIHQAADGFRGYEVGEVGEGYEGLAQFKRSTSDHQELLQRWYHPAPERAPNPGGGGAGGLPSIVENAWQGVPLRRTSVVDTQVYRWL